MLGNKQNDYERLKEIIASGISIPEACKQVGVGKSTYYKWKEMNKIKPGPKRGSKRSKPIQVVSLAVPTMNQATVNSSASTMVLIIQCDISNLSHAIRSISGAL